MKQWGQVTPAVAVLPLQVFGEGRSGSSRGRVRSAVAVLCGLARGSCRCSDPRLSAFIGDSPCNAAEIQWYIARKGEAPSLQNGPHCQNAVIHAKEINPVWIFPSTHAPGHRPSSDSRHHHRTQDLRCIPIEKTCWISSGSMERIWPFIANRSNGSWSWRDSS